MPGRLLRRAGDKRRRSMYERSGIHPRGFRHRCNGFRAQLRSAAITLPAAPQSGDGSAPRRFLALYPRYRRCGFSWRFRGFLKAWRFLSDSYTRFPRRAASAPVPDRDNPVHTINPRAPTHQLLPQPLDSYKERVRAVNEEPGGAAFTARFERRNCNAAALVVDATGRTVSA